MHRAFVRFSAKVALGAVALVALVAASPAPAVVDGYQITLRMTMTQPAAAGAVATPMGPIEMVVKSAGDRMRMDMDMSKLMAGRGGEGDAAMAGAMLGGMFMLVQPDGKVVSVMPSMNMAMVMDPAAMMSGGGPGGLGGMVSVDVDTAGMTFNVQDLGASERILGYATRKYHIESKYRSTTSVMGTSTTENYDIVMDLWITTDPGEALASMRKYTEKFGSMSMGTGANAYTQALGGKIPKNGVALRTNVTSTTEKGTSTVALETTEIKKVVFDAAEFDLPAGVQVIDMGAMMGGRGRGRGGNQ